MKIFATKSAFYIFAATVVVMWPAAAHAEEGGLLLKATVSMDAAPEAEFSGEESEHDVRMAALDSADRGLDESHKSKLEAIGKSKDGKKSLMIADENEKYQKQKKDIQRKRALEKKRHAKRIAELKKKVQKLPPDPYRNPPPDPDYPKRLMKLAEQMDRVATDMQDKAMAAGNQFVEGMSKTVSKTAKFLAQKPGTVLPQMADSLVTYLTNDYNENDRMLYEAAAQAVDEAQKNPAHFFGEHAIDIALAGTGAAGELAEARAVGAAGELAAARELGAAGEAAAAGEVSAAERAAQEAAELNQAAGASAAAEVGPPPSYQGKPAGMTPMQKQQMEAQRKSLEAKRQADLQRKAAIQQQQAQKEALAKQRQEAARQQQDALRKQQQQPPARPAAPKAQASAAKQRQDALRKQQEAMRRQQLAEQQKRQAAADQSGKEKVQAAARQQQDTMRKQQPPPRPSPEQQARKLEKAAQTLKGIAEDAREFSKFNSQGADFSAALEAGKQWKSGVDTITTKIAPGGGANSPASITQTLKRDFGAGKAKDPFHKGTRGLKSHEEGLPLASSQEQIETALQAAGEGGQGIVFVDAGKGVPAKILNVRNKGGNVEFWDFQAYPPVRFRGVSNGSKVFFYRID